MSRSIYLVNPVAEAPGYFGGEMYAGNGLPPGVLVASLALPTLAGMVPADFEVHMCDEHITSIDFDTRYDFVAITGQITQLSRMIAVATEFRRRGRVVIIGGPCASLSPRRLRPHCDVLVRGEVEEIAADLFADLRAGTWQAEYVGTRPDLQVCPAPRWDLYPNERAVAGALQTARGCPFECEFCDVIQYLGRRQRHKTVPQVLHELDQLYAMGYRSVFLADDNFTAWRPRARALLRAVRDWNVRRDDGRMHLMTQLSIEAAEDDALLELCAQAGLNYAFIGLETPNQESLKEIKKRQNLRGDPVMRVHTFLEHGIGVVAGMIVGFDSDGPDIFERQYRFAVDTGIPVFLLGTLVALESTPLYARMAREGRLVSDELESAVAPWTSNIIPRQMTREQLSDGMRWLINRLYEPSAFGARLVQTIERLQPPAEIQDRPSRNRRSIERDAVELVGRLRHAGPQQAAMLNQVLAAAAKKPSAWPAVSLYLLLYQQIRYMYANVGMWESPRSPLTSAPPLVGANAP
ncbi:MAG: B12-binding domain-containing radical SAM protein [Chloroflexi bacterium]|nr:B12-binding domain-containing radical SAM protein [Chloroflexota bacterium]